MMVFGLHRYDYPLGATGRLTNHYGQKLYVFGYNAPNSGDASSPCSLAEYHSLKKELEGKTTQNEDLLIKVKLLTETNKHYHFKITTEEQYRKQQLNILQKTQQTQLEEKDDLIQTLKELLEEQENKLEQMGRDVQGNIEAKESTSPPSTSTTKLVEKLMQLQKEKSTLTYDLAIAHSDAELHEQNQNEAVQNLTQINAKLEKENKELHDEIAKQHTGHSLDDSAITGGCTTDTEKQLEKVQAENDLLTKQVHSLRKLSARPSSISFNTEDSQIKLLQEENETLRNQMFLLQESLDQKESHQREAEMKNRSINMKLSTENQSLLQHLHEFRAEIAVLQGGEPEIMHQRSMVGQDFKVNQQMPPKDKSSVELQQENMKLQKQVEASESKNRDLQAYMTELELEKEKAVAEVRRETEGELTSLRSKCLAMCEKLTSVQAGFDEVMAAYIQLQKLVQQFPSMMAQNINLIKAEMKKAIQGVENQNKELVKKYHREMALRKKYHNELVELKGNIRVFCRVRPWIKEDGTGSLAEVTVKYDQDDDGLVYVDNKGRNQTFEMDRVFTDTSTQVEVFDEVSSLVTSCVDGYNVCIFAYGQTGSGKTYTMEGTTSDPGINQRALQELFRETAEKGSDWDFTITVSVVEIYNENLRDLLNNENSEKLEVKINPDGGFHVPGLKSYEVQNVADVNKVFAVGQKNRATATTNMNEHSSRSHALLCVTVTGVNKTTNTKSVGKLNLVDLAGSERVSKSGADGARLKEAQNINKSLSCLGDVIHALRSKQNHIPYRNSRLTYLLQDSLGGDSKTLMIVQVAPVERNVSETVCSLNFAQRVRTVELGAASKRLESSNDTCENGHSSPYTSPRSTPTSPNINTPRKLVIKKPTPPTPNGTPTTPTTNRKPTTPAANGTPTTPTANRKPTTPTPNGKPTTPTPNGKPTTPTPNGKPTTPTLNGKLTTPLTNGMPNTPLANGKSNTSTPNRKPNTPISNRKPTTPTPTPNRKPGTPTLSRTQSLRSMSPSSKQIIKKARQLPSLQISSLSLD